MKKVELHRRMSSEEVKGVILDAFQCKGFTVLDSAKGGYLLRSGEELTANFSIDTSTLLKKGCCGSTFRGVHSNV